MKITALIRAAAPYARPVLASVAIGWGLGVLAETAKDRQQQLQEQQEAIAAGAAHLQQLHDAIGAQTAHLHQLEQTIIRMETRAADAERVLAEMNRRAAALHNGTGPAVAQAFKERADEETEDPAAPPVAAGQEDHRFPCDDDGCQRCPVIAKQ